MQSFLRKNSAQPGLASLVACLLALVLLAACGDGSPTTSSTVTAAPTTTQALTTAAATPAGVTTAAATLTTAQARPPGATVTSLASGATPVPPTPEATLPPNPSPAGASSVPPVVANVQQPAQPDSGPGGKDYKYAAATIHSYGSGAESYYLAEPQPLPAEPLPVIVLLHGYSDLVTTKYAPWITHLVRRGSIVIFPVYQATPIDRDGERFTDNAQAAIKAAIERMSDGSHARPDLAKFIFVGYSAGGVIATNLTARGDKTGLPLPKALFAVTPGGCANCSVFSIRNFSLAQPAELAAIRPDLKLVVLVGDKDNVVGETASSIIWQNITQIPAANKNYLKVISDNHGKPALIADHGMANRAPPNAHNYYGIWKLLDGLQSCSLANKDCEYALGNTPQQRELGKWSDGTPVTELKVLG